MKVHWHVLARAALAGTLLAPLPWGTAKLTRAESPSGDASVRSLPYHKPPSGHKTPLLGRLIALEAQPRSAEEQPPAPQRAASGGATLERLWDRWQGRRKSPQNEALRTEQPQSPSHNHPSGSESLQLESPQPVRPAGEFPSFRSDNQSPPMPATVPQPAPPQAAQPAPLRTAVSSADEPSKQSAETISPPDSRMPVESRVVRARPIEPTSPDSPPPAARITVRATEPPKPIAAPARTAPHRSTAAYLADDVRYGAVIRHTSSASIDPAREILGESKPIDSAPPQRPSAKPVARLPAARSVANSQVAGQDAGVDFDTVFSQESAAVPQVLPLGAEDLCSMASVLPAPSTQFRGRTQQLDGERISNSASPAMLQHALRHYGLPGGRETPSLKPVSAAEPVLEQPIPAANSEARQRSVLLGGDKPLGFHRANNATNSPHRGQSSPSHRGLQGSVAGVDKERGTILVQFPGNRLPAVGSKVQVYQKVLIKRDLLGEFRVVDVQGNAVVAQPLGRIDLDLILNGDEATAI